MNRGTIATAWHAADDAEKLRMLQAASRSDCPVSTELLDDTTENLDRVAAGVGGAGNPGLVAIRVHCVDEAGMRYPADAVVSAAFARNHRPRPSAKLSRAAAPGARLSTQYDFFIHAHCRAGLVITLQRKADGATTRFHLAAATQAEPLWRHLGSLTDDQCAAFYPGTKQHRTKAPGSRKGAEGQAAGEVVG